MIKKAAMFGLDARIALAIFGALSVISGAALYSAIQNAKVTANITQLEEYGKAYYAYYLDTGSELPSWSGNLFDVEAHHLLSSSVAGWQGPYLASMPASSSHAWKLAPSGFNHFYFVRATNATWDDGTALTAATCEKVANKGKCEAWIVLGPYDPAILNAIDERIDGAVDTDEGRVRQLGTYIYYNIGISDVGK
tara:strand:+ start:3800 stop:4381 length:582 start_codon:yes stop_codon:yes gene_type:complete